MEKKMAKSLGRVMGIDEDDMNGMLAIWCMAVRKKP